MCSLEANQQVNSWLKFMVSSSYERTLQVDYHIFLGMGLLSRALRARVELRFSFLFPNDFPNVLYNYMQ